MAQNTIGLHDEEGAVYSDSNPVPINEGYATFDTGAKTVTTAGTAEALVGSATVARLVSMTANSTNTGRIAFGDSAVTASTDGSSIGAGETIVLPVPGNALGSFYIDATVSGEGVKFTYFN
ncbi:MAG: hypothetical protein DWQ49_08900 [Bacteroidetes bacterium]|nr:MAG: hypothetical protein DWQ49_08900 [Bacteroidota bacterium]